MTMPNEEFEKGRESRQPEIDALKQNYGVCNKLLQKFMQENAALKAEVANLNNKLIDEILARQELNAENERLRKDAERYRKVRANSLSTPFAIVDKNLEIVCDDEADNLIDAAMMKETK